MQKDQVGFEDILKYDNQCFVKPNSKFREDFLRKWLSISKSSAVIAMNSCEQVVGYGCQRPAFQEGNHLIGPLYADNYDIAHDIISKLVEGLENTTIMFDVW